MHLRHPTSFPPKPQISHHISQKRFPSTSDSSPWPRIWLRDRGFDSSLPNVLRACARTREVNGRWLARYPQHRNITAPSAQLLNRIPSLTRLQWPNSWCGPFRPPQVCRVQDRDRTRIKGGFLNGPTTWRVTSAAGSSLATASCHTTGMFTLFIFYWPHLMSINFATSPV